MLFELRTKIRSEMMFRWINAIVCLGNVASQRIRQRIVYIQKRRNKFIVQLKNELLKLNEEKNERSKKKKKKSGKSKKRVSSLNKQRNERELFL